MLKVTSGLGSLYNYYQPKLSEREGGVGFLVCECLVNEVEFINTVK